MLVKITTSFAPAHLCLVLKSCRNLTLLSISTTVLRVAFLLIYCCHIGTNLSFKYRNATDLTFIWNRSLRDFHENITGCKFYRQLTISFLCAEENWQKSYPWNIGEINNLTPCLPILLVDSDFTPSPSWKLGSLHIGDPQILLPCVPEILAYIHYDLEPKFFSCFFGFVWTILQL